MPTPTATIPPITLKGDANCNGLVNLFDIKTMLAKYAGVPEALNAQCPPNLDLQLRSHVRRVIYHPLPLDGGQPGADAPARLQSRFGAQVD